MEKFCLFELHEYMDMYPQKEVITFVGEDEEAIRKNAMEYARSMTASYSGGPTTFIKVMSKEDAEAHIKSLIEYEEQHPQPDSEEFIQNIWDLYYRCY